LTATSLTPSSELSPEEHEEIGQALGRLRQSTTWWIGDWWVYGEHKYGARKEMVEADDWQGPGFLIPETEQAHQRTCASISGRCR